MSEDALRHIDGLLRNVQGIGRCKGITVDMLQHVNRWFLHDQHLSCLSFSLGLGSGPTRRQNPHKGGDRREPRVVVVRTHIDDLGLAHDRKRGP